MEHSGQKWNDGGTDSHGCGQQCRCVQRCRRGGIQMHGYGMQVAVRLSGMERMNAMRNGADALEWKPERRAVRREQECCRLQARSKRTELECPYTAECRMSDVTGTLEGVSLGRVNGISDFRTQLQEAYRWIAGRMWNDWNLFQEFESSGLFLSSFFWNSITRSMHNEPKHIMIIPTCPSVG